MRPRLLDLFCGAGGAGEGYHRAGFDVVGVDINPQPNYPFTFVRADVMRVFWEGFWILGGISDFDAIHASPPCQAYSTTKSLHDTSYPDLVGPVRDLLLETGKPYVIENVAGAPLIQPFKLCGSSFGLNVWRHRLFETNWDVGMVPPCSHREFPAPIDVTGTGSRRIYDRLDGAGGNSRKPRNLEEAQTAMGIDWMTRRELSEAIPPAYTEFIGSQLLAHIGAPVA
jgi:DNA (cytosine-5)-methyltransferase 1